MTTDHDNEAILFLIGCAGEDYYAASVRLRGEDCLSRAAELASHTRKGVKLSLVVDREAGRYAPHRTEWTAVATGRAAPCVLHAQRAEDARPTG